MNFVHQQREEISLQEYVRLQETFNTIIRSLERIERLDNNNRANPVKINAEADRIHSEYNSMKEALTTQCLCLQIGMRNPKFQNNEIKRDLAEQVNEWKKNRRGQQSDKVREALSFVDQAIQGKLNFDDFTTARIPSDHRQAVGSILRARDNLDEISRQAINDPREYYENQQYRLRMSQQFSKKNNNDRMQIDKPSNEDKKRLNEELQKLINDKNKLEKRMEDSTIPYAKNNLQFQYQSLKEKIKKIENKLKIND